MKAINIKWDTDGDMDLLESLPTEIEIPKEMDDDEISDYISDQTGFCHYGFDLCGELCDINEKFRIENIIEITFVLAEHYMKRHIVGFQFQEFKECIEYMAEEFESIHVKTDWAYLDYMNEIRKFANKKIAIKLWMQFGRVLVNLETEEIESEWNGFAAGTHREDIWHWFEETFDVSVAEDLMRLGRTE